MAEPRNSGGFPEKSTHRAISFDFSTTRKKFLYVLVEYFALILLNHIKCVYRLGSSLRLP